MGNKLEETELFKWKQKVYALHYAESRLEKKFNNGEISLYEKRKIKKRINQMWLDIWKFHPDNNPLLEQAFKLNFFQT